MKDSYNRPKSRTVLGIALLIQLCLLILFWFAEPLRVSKMDFDPQGMKEKAKEVADLNEKRKEREKARREKTLIKAKDAAKLKEKEERKHKKKLVNKLNEMRQIKKSLVAKKLKKFEDLKARTPKDIRRNEMADILVLAQKAVDLAYHLRLRCGHGIAQNVEADCKKLLKSTQDYQRDLSQEGVKRLVGLSTAIELQIVNELAQKTEKLETSSFKYFGVQINEAIKNYQEALASLTFDNNALADLSALPEHLTTENSESDLKIMPLTDIYEEITQLEAEVNQDYKEYKAAELASIQNTSFEEALNAVDSMMSPNAATANDDQKTNGTASEQQNSSGQQASQKGGAHHDEPAKGQPKGQGESQNGGVKTVGELNAFRDSLNRKTSRAMKSLSKVRNMAHQAGVLSGSEEQGKSAQALMSSAASSSQSSSQGGGSMSGNGGGNKKGSKAIDVEGVSNKKNPGDTIKIPEEMVKAKALPGRKFKSDSQRQGWLYIDTWYIIGPWENNAKLDYKRTHPPEVEMDFDASYLGKKDTLSGEPRVLKWRFVQSNTMKIKIPDEQSNSTYYCYTEVFFEEDTQMLLAIASDDAARMWVGDELCWEDHGLSGWNLSEGFRTVKFKKGFNSIRVRMENFPKLCEFSVLLCPVTKKEL